MWIYASQFCEERKKGVSSPTITILFLFFPFLLLFFPSFFEASFVNSPSLLISTCFFVILPFKANWYRRRSPGKNTRFKCVFVHTHMTIIPKYFCQPFTTKWKYRPISPRHPAAFCCFQSHMMYNVYVCCICCVTWSSNPFYKWVFPRWIMLQIVSIVHPSLLLLLFSFLILAWKRWFI